MVWQKGRQCLQPHSHCQTDGQHRESVYLLSVIAWGGGGGGYRQMGASSFAESVIVGGGGGGRGGTTKMIARGGS